jgi:hypothetical protein
MHQLKILFNQPLYNRRNGYPVSFGSINEPFRKIGADGEVVPHVRFCDAPAAGFLRAGRDSGV